MVNVNLTGPKSSISECQISF